MYETCCKINGQEFDTQQCGAEEEVSYAKSRACPLENLAEWLQITKDMRDVLSAFSLNMPSLAFRTHKEVDVLHFFILCSLHPHSENGTAPSYFVPSGPVVLHRHPSPIYRRMKEQ